MHVVGPMLKLTLLLLASLRPTRALRNVDRCEALFFTNAVLASGSDAMALRSGVGALVDDARAQSALVAAVGAFA